MSAPAQEPPIRRRTVNRGPPGHRSLGLAFALVLGWHSQSPAAAPAEDLALVNPHVAPGDVVLLPRPLDAEAVDHARRFFQQRARGRMRAASDEAASLGGTVLAGPVQAELLLARATRPKAEDLTAWLLQFGDQPDAPALHDLLLATLPRGATPPPPPAVRALGEGAEYALPDDPPDRPAPLVADVPVPAGARSAPRSGVRSGAMVQRLFLRGEDDAAETLAWEALASGTPASLSGDGSPDGIGLAGFAGGLAAWRAGRFAEAVPLFEMAWMAPATPRDIRVAGAFWASRARRLLGDGPGAVAWMHRASEHPLSFYGMVARRSLGMDDGFVRPKPSRAGRGGTRDDERDTLGEADVAAIDATPGGHRAFALLQIGQTARAQTEFRCLWEAVGEDADLRRSMRLVARRAGFSALAARMAELLRKPGMRDAEDDRFPAPLLAPAAGFAIPPPLVYGVTKMESDFDPLSVSSVGARGLMQLMPATAVEVAGDPSLAAAGIARLHDPALNLDLGQRFLVQLGRMPALQGDLMRVLASYYSGPAAVAAWSDSRRDGGDPLLFLESIPADDVRLYVRRGLTYAWVYAARFRLPPPGLDDIAAGRFPKFAPLAAPRGFLPPHLRP